MKSRKQGIAAVLVALLTWVATTERLEAQINPATFQITSGKYRVDGGFVGSTLYSLPREEQSLVALTLDPMAGTARLAILPRGGAVPFLELTNGVVAGDEIRFHYSGAATSGAPATVTTDYAVTNRAGLLSMSGTTLVEYANPCNDCPEGFAHLNVQASLIPTLSVRVSEVEFCWPAASHQTYQVQFRSAATTNLWTNLGVPVVGDGSVHCVQDKVVAGVPERFYRVALSP